MDIWDNEIKADIKYNIYLVSALVDCLSRNGELKSAYDLIKEYESNDNMSNEVMYNSLMNGCKKFNDTIMGEQIYKEYQLKFGENISLTVSMSNMYGMKFEYDKVTKIRDELKLKGLNKIPVLSEIEIH